MELWLTATLFGSLLCIFLLAAVLYIRLILRYPEALEKWISTVAIFIGHAQSATPPTAPHQPRAHTHKIHTTRFLYMSSS